jgi:hypothetical protein
MENKYTVFATKRYTFGKGGVDVATRATTKDDFKTLAECRKFRPFGRQRKTETLEVWYVVEKI